MMKRVADALLRRVYYPVIAVVCTDGQEGVISVVLLDSFFADADSVVAPETREVIVVCSHPDGRRSLAPEEISCCRRIAAQAGQACVRIYIYGEDDGLCPVDSGEILGYNGENAI